MNPTDEEQRQCNVAVQDTCTPVVVDFAGGDITAN
jgi:hypothetical protein